MGWQVDPNYNHPVVPSYSPRTVLQRAWYGVKGPPYALLPSSARLTDEGWKSVTKRAATRKKAEKGKSGGG
jgi:hypothetical protein